MSLIIPDEYPFTSAQPEIFQGRGGLVKLGHFNKYFIKKLRKKAPQGKILEFFCSDTLSTNGKFNLRMDTIRAFFSKIRAFFFIFKKGQGRPPPLLPSCVPDLGIYRLGL